MQENRKPNTVRGFVIYKATELNSVSC